MMAIKSILLPPYVRLNYPRNISLQNGIVCINYSLGKISETDNGKGTGIGNGGVLLPGDKVRSAELEVVITTWPFCIKHQPAK